LNEEAFYKEREDLYKAEEEFKQGPLNKYQIRVKQDFIRMSLEAGKAKEKALYEEEKALYKKLKDLRKLPTKEEEALYMKMKAPQMSTSLTKEEEALFKKLTEGGWKPITNQERASAARDIRWRLEFISKEKEVLSWRKEALYKQGADLYANKLKAEYGEFVGGMLALSYKTFKFVGKHPLAVTACTLGIGAAVTGALIWGRKKASEAERIKKELEAKAKLDAEWLDLANEEGPEGPNNVLSSEIPKQGDDNPSSLDIPQPRGQPRRRWRWLPFSS
jgi:hypothetical protein